MATAKQLPSGKWRAQVYIDGKYVSVTRDTKKEAEYAALEAQMEHKREMENMTVGKAIEGYIASKDGVLDPTTIAGYRKILRNNYQDTLLRMPLKSLNERIVQAAFNDEAKRITCRGTAVSPKSMRNARGLFTAAMKQYDLSFDVTVPAKRKIIRDLPAPEEIYPLIAGTDIELPCLLAMWMSFTMSEIRGLRVEDINQKKGTIAINRVIVDVDGLPTVKAKAKEYERNRVVGIPPYIMGLICATPAWEAGEGYIITTKAQTIARRFKRIVNEAGYSITFHDLRHIFASVMLSLKIPDKYAMQRGGWKTNTTLKRVYQETFSAERLKTDAQLDGYFANIVASFHE